MLKSNYAKTNLGISVRILSKIMAVAVLQNFNFLNNKPLNRLKYALVVNRTTVNKYYFIYMK